jgi:bacillithiol biosynthesis deacetylase BshB1
MPLDVLAVGAHPDDVEVAVGGTLARMAQQGYRVGIVDLTDGEPTPLSSGPEERMAEAAEAAKILGVHVRETLTLPNRRLFDSFEARVALAKVIRSHRPRLVLGIAGKTPMASPDHWQAMQITDAAVFYARLTKWDQEFGGLPVHTVPKLLWYPLGFDQIHLADTAGAFVSDITETLELKLAAVRAYKSQFPPAKDRVLRILEAQALTLGGLCGTLAGEMLISPKPILAADVLKTLHVVSPAT